MNVGNGNEGRHNIGDDNKGDVNIGNGNIGNGNKGNVNVGNWNEGDWNVGNGNVGDDNKGNWNKGNGNVGDDNVGNVNEGNGNVGDDNVGNVNEGDGNIGDGNEGYYNVGNGNVGNGNVGDDNKGNRNKGNGNVGDDNKGNWNKGNVNVGNWNEGDGFIGYFNTGTPVKLKSNEIQIFNIVVNKEVGEDCYRRYKEGKVTKEKLKQLIKNLFLIDNEENHAKIELKVNTVLATKDGRVVGNAIIINDSICREPYSNKVYKILTDYGNEMILLEKDIYNRFYVMNVSGSGVLGKKHINHVYPKCDCKND